MNMETGDLSLDLEISHIRRVHQRVREALIEADEALDLAEETTGIRFRVQPGGS